MAETDAPSFWWIVAFLLLALGLGAAAIFAVGGTLIASSGGVVVPPVLF
jgi:hypothetical protein